MKKHNILRRLLITAGFLPFTAPLVLGLPPLRASSLTYGDFLILYSYLFWPTYILGGLLILSGILLHIRQSKAKMQKTNRSDTKEETSCSTEK